MEEVVEYRCKLCGEEYATETEAEECCKHTELALSYRCATCKNLYTFRAAAMRCCSEEETTEKLKAAQESIEFWKQECEKIERKLDTIRARKLT